MILVFNCQTSAFLVGLTLLKDFLASSISPALLVGVFIGDLLAWL